MILKTYFIIKKDSLSNALFLYRDESTVVYDDNISKYEIVNIDELNKPVIMYSFVPFLGTNFRNINISTQLLKDCCEDKKVFLCNFSELKKYNIDRLIDLSYSKPYDIINDPDKIECLETLSKNFFFDHENQHDLFKYLNITQNENYEFVNINEDWISIKKELDYIRTEKIKGNRL